MDANLESKCDKNIAKEVLEILKTNGKTVSTAESCTGGTIAKMITAVPGSSAVFKGSVVSYATEVKENVLGVNHLDVEKYTVVSQQVAEQMAIGVRKLLKTDYAVSTTGIAGPDGGTELTPVGTVWIAVATPEKVISKLNMFFGTGRIENIELAATAALEMLKQELEK